MWYKYIRRVAVPSELSGRPRDKVDLPADDPEVQKLVRRGYIVALDLQPEPAVVEDEPAPEEVADADDIAPFEADEDGE